MTRKEAIEYNKNLRVYMRITDKKSKYKFLNENYEALDMAIKALEQEPCEDAVSRQAVLDKIYDVDGMEALENSNIFAKHYANMVKSIPSITPKPKTGHWIWIVDESPATPVSSYELNWSGWACDCCRKQPDDDSDWDDGDNPPKYKYCPNCGAKMAEREDKG